MLEAGRRRPAAIAEPLSEDLRKRLIAAV